MFITLLLLNVFCKNSALCLHSGNNFVIMSENVLKKPLDASEHMSTVLLVSYKCFLLCLQNTINTRNVCTSSQERNLSRLTKKFSHNQDILANDHMLTKCVQSATFCSLKTCMPWFFFTLRFLYTRAKSLTGLQVSMSVCLLYSHSKALGVYSWSCFLWMVWSLSQ